MEICKDGIGSRGVGGVGGVGALRGEGGGSVSQSQTRREERQRGGEQGR